MTVAQEFPRIEPLRDPRRGLVLFAIGIALFSILNGVVKAQAALFPLNQIVFFRNAFALIPILLMLQAAGGLGLLRTPRLREHALLSALFTLTLFMVFAAYAMMPLADATAISFTQPLIVTLMSLVFAAEAVKRAEWVAVGIGLLGVILVVQPSGQGSVMGASLALGAAVISAGTMLLQRRLSATENTHVITFYTLGLSAAVLLPSLAVSWVMPTGPQLLGLVAMGLASGLCQYLTVRAFYHAPASTIAPLTYTKLIWAILIGFVWFGEVPTPLVIAGSLVVIGSTLVAFRGSRAG